MLLAEILLWQRYAMSFFTTTFVVIVLTAQSSLAFNIAPPRQENFKESESYDLPEISQKGITTLIPIDFKGKGLAPGGTPRLKAALRKENPGVVFNAPNDLAGTFEVTSYQAQGFDAGVGGGINLLYKPGEGDPEFSNNRLRWIQVTPQKVNGKEEDYLLRENDESFIYLSLRGDADQPQKWLAEIYLVEETEPNHVTIYNGIEWGWENTVENVQ
jgi:hypothetical protein